VRGKDTAPDVLATAMAVGRRINKVPVVVGVATVRRQPHAVGA
jgi:3-hydroxyacyl-CoA dehydrogenase